MCLTLYRFIYRNRVESKLLLEMDCSMIKVRFIESNEVCWLYKGDPIFSKIYNSIESKSTNLIPNMILIKNIYQKVIYLLFYDVSYNTLH